MGFPNRFREDPDLFLDGDYNGYINQLVDLNGWRSVPYMIDPTYRDWMGDLRRMVRGYLRIYPQPGRSENDWVADIANQALGYDPSSDPRAATEYFQNFDVALGKLEPYWKVIVHSKMENQVRNLRNSRPDGFLYSISQVSEDASTGGFGFGCVSEETIPAKEASEFEEGRGVESRIIEVIGRQFREKGRRKDAQRRDGPRFDGRDRGLLRWYLREQRKDPKFYLRGVEERFSNFLLYQRRGEDARRILQLLVHRPTLTPKYVARVCGVGVGVVKKALGLRVEGMTDHRRVAAELGLDPRVAERILILLEGCGDRLSEKQIGVILGGLTDSQVYGIRASLEEYREHFVAACPELAEAIEWLWRRGAGAPREPGVERRRGSTLRKKETIKGKTLDWCDPREGVRRRVRVVGAGKGKQDRVVLVDDSGLAVGDSFLVWRKDLGL